jgi:hypothetical protein
MPKTLAALAKLLDEIPPDISAYFQEVSGGSLTGHEEVELNLIMPRDAAALTAQFREFHPVVQVLQGVVLDDPDTSNHHVYLSTKCCAGTVLYLDHDGDSRIVSPSLVSFLEWLDAHWKLTDVLRSSIQPIAYNCLIKTG